MSFRIGFGVNIKSKINREKKPKRVIIIDPQLKDSLGHNYRYAKGIKSMFAVDTIIVGNKCAKIPSSEIDILPLLSFDQYDNSAYKKAFRENPVSKYERFSTVIRKRVESAYAIFDRNSPLGKSLGLIPWIFNVIFFLFGFLYQLFKFVFGYGNSAHQDTVSQEVIGALDGLNVCKGDLVIFQTMLWPTFESLLEINISRASAYPCQAMFIMHEDWNIYHSMFGRFTPSNFERRVLESLPFEQSKVVVTNSKLQEYCAQWMNYRPEVIDEISFNVNGEDKLNNNPKSDKIRILIPGVYRGDKNFEYISQFFSCIDELDVDYSITLHESVINQINLPPEYSDNIELYSNIENYDKWLDFLASYSVVFIPYCNAYQRRISGILHECKLLNIPIICDESIADSIYISNPELLIRLSDRESLCLALEFIENCNYQTQFFENYKYLSLTESYECQYGWTYRLEKPLAVVVKPAWTRCGTSVVLDHQNNVLTDFGYFVIEIFLKGEPWVRRKEQIDFMYEVQQGGRLNSGGMISRILLKNTTLPRLFYYITQLLLGKYPNYLQREEEHLSWCDIDQKLLDYTNKNTPELVLVNHVFNSKFVSKFFPSSLKICETHDIQLNQFAITRQYLRDRYQQEFDYEMKRLSEFDCVVNLNKVEHLSIQNAIGEKAIYIRPPIFKWASRFEYENLSALLKEQASVLDSSNIPDRVDLLIVADGHPANIQSVSNFLTEVFYKASSDLSLGIVGSVCRYLEVDWNEKKSLSLYFFGYLKDLSNIYDFCEIVVLPDIYGEGIPIKTDEAIANSANIIAFDKAVRGFTSSEIESLELNVFGSAGDMLKYIDGYFPLDSSYSRYRYPPVQIPDGYRVENYYKAWKDILSN
ncbi:hypothetical protein [Sessilibacter corallicola]|uniref:Glycosyl transferase family 1 domain-containing protein n=1 Tax=Sessilibacter corallicola TaxID=2904075 RepID=A0ABQ0A829_9GAMM